MSAGDLSGLVIRPGDHVIVALHDVPDDARAAELAEPAAALYGSTTPRLWTRPVLAGPAGPCGCGCALSPSTSLGFEAVVFAEDVLGVELLPWQRRWLIHALELRPDDARAAELAEGDT